MSAPASKETKEVYAQIIKIIGHDNISKLKEITGNGWKISVDLLFSLSLEREVKKSISDNPSEFDVYRFANKEGVSHWKIRRIIRKSMKIKKTIRNNGKHDELPKPIDIAN